MGYALYKVEEQVFIQFYLGREEVRTLHLLSSTAHFIYECLPPAARWKHTALCLHHVFSQGFEGTRNKLGEQHAYQ